MRIVCALVASATTAMAASLATGVGLPANVATKPRGDGQIFTDSRGLTLYTFDRDEGTPGFSSCNDECAENWPPLFAAASAQPVGEWSTIARADRALQWAYRGRPLYFFKADPAAGTTFGDGVDNRWHIAFEPIATPREIAIGRTVLGQVLTDIHGHTLYASKSGCEEQCLRTWDPVAAPALAHAFGEWTLVVRASGLRQWAYKGQPLFRRPASDIVPGDVSGGGEPGWSVMVLEPAPPLPPWATVQASDAGELIANAAGLTLYTREPNRVYQRKPAAAAPAEPAPSTACAGDSCLDAQWQPVIASADAKPLGSWALAKLADGRRQWTYKGRPLYLNLNDRKPGDFMGIRFGARISSRYSWAVIMRSGLPMQGVSAG